MLKLLVLFLVMFTNVYASDVELNSYNVFGLKRKMDLYTLGAHSTGRFLYIGSRMDVAGNDRASESPIIIFKDVRTAVDGKYVTVQGFKMNYTGRNVNSLRTYRVASAKAEEYQYSGKKKDLFLRIFSDFSTPSANDLYTGEVRIIVDKYKTDLYKITGRIQYVLK